MNDRQLTDEQQLAIVKALLARPDRPPHWALWWEDGQLWERTGLQGKARRLAWFEAMDMVGMRKPPPIQPGAWKCEIRKRRRSVREIRESLRADLEHMGALPLKNPGVID